MNQNQADQPKGLQRKVYEVPDCPICLDELVQDLACAPCGHVFHQLCIFQNFENSSTCPCCRKRMTRANITGMNYDLKCNDEAEEQIQAFYNSLSQNERQNVVEIMNKFENQTREFTSVKRHRDELVVMCREQQDKIQNLEKSDKELSSTYKKLVIKAEQLKQKAELEENKRKDLQSLHDSDLETIQELKKNLSELRHIQILKEQMEQGGSNEHKVIEDIKKNKPIEEQAQKFYEMLRMKKGAFEELSQENKMLQSQIKQMQQEIESQKSEAKFKNNKLNEQNLLISRLQEKVKRLQEVMNNQKKLFQDKLTNLKSQINQNQNIFMSSHSNNNNKQSGMINLDEENSNFSIFSIEDQKLNKNSSSLSSNDLASIQNPFYIQDQKNKMVSEDDQIQQTRQYSMNNNREKKETALESMISQSQDSIGFLKESLSKENSSNNININEVDNQIKKRTFEYNLENQLKKTPKYEQSKLFQTNQQASEAPAFLKKTSGQGLFGIAMNKNSLLNKSQQTKQTQNCADQSTNQKKTSITSINDFFQRGKKK
ncbi:erythrocyte-binding protein (macronuclear) [Tetrahymena thermophila SB210]|uniref:Erythrocyte-binding protein n=1 Tax=Tetrahymena thermophila (strain SB210) TaxID=312017 RepID=Q23JF4_TETTS|nr:erythrocyte-binding protein [Tetrahymena thermophila SB210]EAR96550.2 erythrocyte-binding protein [Tetrahymena thermophila SB210]|eukprot:XP_001016795.2 erythrocyte-binding protein [Tetrahymena thermophila SB210]